MARQLLEYHTLAASGGFQCLSMRTFLALRTGGRNPAHHRAPTNIATSPANAAWSREFAELSAAVAGAFGERVGRDVRAMTLKASPGEEEKLFRFLQGGESSAAVLALDLAVLARIWPRCEWENPLLSIRNHLADHGIKFYVAMTPPAVQHHLLDWLALPCRRLIAHQVDAFCAENAIGFIDVSRDEPAATHARKAQQRTYCRLAARIAIALASARNFCDGRFRIGGREASDVEMCRSPAN